MTSSHNRHQRRQNWQPQMFECLSNIRPINTPETLMHGNELGDRKVEATFLPQRLIFSAMGPESPYNISNNDFLSEGKLKIHIQAHKIQGEICYLSVTWSRTQQDENNSTARQEIYFIKYLTTTSPYLCGLYIILNPNGPLMWVTLLQAQLITFQENIPCCNWVVVQY